jgi:hypothetical protein
MDVLVGAIKWKLEKIRWEEIENEDLSVDCRS